MAWQLGNPNKYRWRRYGLLQALALPRPLLCCCSRLCDAMGVEQGCRAAGQVRTQPSLFLSQPCLGAQSLLGPAGSPHAEPPKCAPAATAVGCPWPFWACFCHAPSPLKFSRSAGRFGACGLASGQIPPAFPLYNSLGSSRCRWRLLPELNWCCCYCRRCHRRCWCCRGLLVGCREIVEAVGIASRLFLATDPDREGEAISWHLAQELQVGAPLLVGPAGLSWSQLPLLLPDSGQQLPGATDRLPTADAALLLPPRPPPPAPCPTPRRARRCHQGALPLSASPSARSPGGRWRRRLPRLAPSPSSWWMPTWPGGEGGVLGGCMVQGEPC